MSFISKRLRADQIALTAWIHSIVTIIFLLFWVAEFAYAHKINVFAWVEGDRIQVDAYFTKSAKVMNTAVKILDLRGNLLLEGKTDQQGQYTFTVKELVGLPPDGLHVVVEADQGHRGEYTLTKSDFPEGSLTQTVHTQSLDRISEKNVHEATATPSPRIGSQSQGAQDLNAQQLSKILGEVIDARLEPISKTLTAQQKLLVEMRENNPSITEIVGGIGWIVGLFGVAGYLMGRRNSSNRT